MNPLREKIEQEIRKCGPIPFSRYMELCLYDAEFGYYSRSEEQFGKAGDFYTSSDVHAIFGRLLARQFEEMWRILGSPARIDLVELGPGRGLFAQDVLDWSEKKFPEFFDAMRYVLVERSPALRVRIEQTLSKHLQSGKAVIPNQEGTSAAIAASPFEAETGTSKLVSFPSSSGMTEDGSLPISPSPVSAPPNSETATIIFANEFFDALPVEIVGTQGSLRIDSREGRFAETWARSSVEELEFLGRYSVRPEPGERLEVPLAAQTCMEQIATGIERGFFIAIDYGYTREEQLAGRHRGTLKAIRKHSISGSPYEAPGEQDLTADVNFTALAAVAERHGMQTHKLVTQSQFLLGIGEATQFADAFEDCRLPQERAKRALQLKHLITPAGMAESFHVMVASKGIEKEKAAGLAGMSFGLGRR